jgi:TPR repeat protein
LQAVFETIVRQKLTASGYLFGSLKKGNSKINKLVISLTIVLLLYIEPADADNTSEIWVFEQALNVGMSALRRQDYEAAFEQLEKAAKLGNKVAQYNLALLYMDGSGVSQDYAQAYLWLNVAAEAREKTWRRLLEQLHNSLSQDQIAALTPHVNSHLEKYGARAQGVNCGKRPSIGTKIAVMQCTKRPAPRES